MSTVGGLNWCPLDVLVILLLPILGADQSTRVFPVRPCGNVPRVSKLGVGARSDGRGPGACAACGQVVIQGRMSRSAGRLTFSSATINNQFNAEQPIISTSEQFTLNQTTQLSNGQARTRSLRRKTSGTGKSETCGGALKRGALRGGYE